MKVELPSTGAYDALVLPGVTQTGSTESAEMAVVLKAAYDLVDDGSGVHDLVPAADGSRAALVLADEGTHRFTDGSGTHTIPASEFGTEPADHPTHPGAPYFDLAGVRHYVKQLGAGEKLEFDLAREADLALDKERSDVVVEGMGGPAVAGAVKVAGQTWFTREAAAQSVGDTGRHLFGWHSRTEPPRAGILAGTYDPATDGAIPTGDTASFNNVYRRSAGFATPGDSNAAPLPSRAVVQVFLNADATGSPTFSARLPGLARAMRLRVFCGHGPDVAPRWRIVPRPALTPDTLVLRPAAKTAEVMWRGRWPADSWPAETYRSVQIAEGAF